MMWLRWSRTENSSVVGTEPSASGWVLLDHARIRSVRRPRWHMTLDSTRRGTSCPAAAAASGPPASCRDASGAEPRAVAPRAWWGGIIRRDAEDRDTTVVASPTWQIGITATSAVLVKLPPARDRRRHRVPCRGQCRCNSSGAGVISAPHRGVGAVVRADGIDRMLEVGLGVGNGEPPRIERLAHGCDLAGAFHRRLLAGSPRPGGHRRATGKDG